MKPTRRAQPFRKGSTLAGPAAMFRGAPAHMPNPQDTRRGLAKALRRKPKRRAPAGRLAGRLRGTGR